MEITISIILGLIFGALININVMMVKIIKLLEKRRGW